MCDRASLRRVFAFRFDRKGVPAKYVEMPLGERLLVELAAFCRRRDGIEHAGVGDSRFGVIRDKLVTIRGDADPRVARFLDHDSLEDGEFPADTKTAFARWRDVRERVRSRLPCLRASSIIWTALAASNRDRSCTCRWFPAGRYALDGGTSTANPTHSAIREMPCRASNRPSGRLGVSAWVQRRWRGSRRRSTDPWGFLPWSTFLTDPRFRGSRMTTLYTQSNLQTHFRSRSAIARASRRRMRSYGSPVSAKLTRSPASEKTRGTICASTSLTIASRPRRRASVRYRWSWSPRRKFAS